VRYPRGEGLGVEALPARGSVLPIGKGRVLRQGTNIAILSYGARLQECLKAAEELATFGLSCTVADARFAKPLDAALIAQLAGEHDLLVTVEEGVLQGGFGSAVLEHCSDHGITTRILRVGLPDRYVTHGKPALLHAEVGFTGKAIAQRVTAALGVGGEIPAEA
jgi:1-deoxy-D-xylulose-5-phosphate synthase